MKMAETPHYAHVIALLFLGTVLVIFICLVVAIIAAFRKMSRIAEFAAGGAALTVIGYSAVLFGVALATRDQTLPPGNWKYFCEVDCHIAYSVDSVQEASTLDPEAKPIPARGRFIVVRLKSWFDQNSISPTRGDFPLTPNPRVAKLVDDGGRQYFATPDFAAAVHATSVSLDTPLRPGESYLTTLVFDVPTDARNPRLLVSDVDAVSRILVDHENSPVHGKIYLSLRAEAPASTSEPQ
jgi:hypothetical protein